MMNNIILKEISKYIIPLIQIFSIYIILHGHISPGGGFAGGTIFATSLILYRLAYGNERARKKADEKKIIRFLCCALIFYGLLKGYSFISESFGIDCFKIPLGTPGKVLSGGYILPLNISIGIVVASIIYLIFSLFSEGEV